MFKKIKKLLCRHEGIEATIIENPSPLVFLDIKANCSNCGLSSDKSIMIYIRAHSRYRDQLANSVLFQRNIEKFPDFYNRAREHYDGVKHET